MGNVRGMTIGSVVTKEQDHFDKENEIIADIIQRGQFLSTQQGIQIGEWIAEGLTKGLTQPIELPKRLEGID